MRIESGGEALLDTREPGRQLRAELRGGGGLVCQDFVAELVLCETERGDLPRHLARVLAQEVRLLQDDGPEEAPRETSGERPQRAQQPVPGRDGKRDDLARRWAARVRCRRGAAGTRRNAVRAGLAAGANVLPDTFHELVRIEIVGMAGVLVDGAHAAGRTCVPGLAGTAGTTSEFCARVNQVMMSPRVQDAMPERR